MRTDLDEEEGGGRDLVRALMEELLRTSEGSDLLCFLLVVLDCGLYHVLCLSAVGTPFVLGPFNWPLRTLLDKRGMKEP